jgi:uncharacterized protein Usg
MRIYYFANVNNPTQLLTFQETSQLLRKYGLTVIDNVKAKPDFEMSDQGGIEQIDAVIIDSSGSDAEAGYLLAVAIAHKKPVLYMLPTGTKLDPSVKALTMNKTIKEYLRVEFFLPKNFEVKVREFLQYLDQDIGKENHSVKFTLRLTPKIERYLHWKAENLDTNKADFVRQQLEDIMKHDETYRKRLE